MACRNSFRWGSGTTSERPQNTEAVREMDIRMKAMMAERARVDALWDSPQPQPQTESKPQKSTDTQLRKKSELPK
jgi:hypothetical protein